MRRIDAESRAAAGFFGIKQRRIFQIVETEAVHFMEIEAGAAMSCITSSKETLDDGQALTPTDKKW
jgi:hypothetical protein